MRTQHDTNSEHGHNITTSLKGRTALCIRHMPMGPTDRIVRELRRRGCVVSHCYPYRGDVLPSPRHHDFVIVYGGWQSVLDLFSYLDDEMAYIAERVSYRRPMLGICLGAQLMARALGAVVTRAPNSGIELGYRPIAPSDAANDMVSQPFTVFQWHEDGFSIPSVAQALARGYQFPHQGFRIGNKIIGLQFHPEVTAGMIRYWHTRSSSDFRRPGADPLTRVLLDGQRYDRSIARWLSEFLTRWTMS